MTLGNDQRTIVTFAIIAFLILGMACVNFTNLATARASQRAREVALRKVLGANRQQLITQFLAESVLIAGDLDGARARHGRAAAAGAFQLPRCRPGDDLFRHGRHAAADPGADPAGRRGRWRLPGFLPVALPAGRGAQGQQVVGRSERHRPAPQRPRRRPVRGVDRTHHLHRRRLRPDRLCAHRRSRLPPRRPDPDRESRPPSADVARQIDRRGDGARSRRGLGRPLRHRHRHPATTTGPASRSRASPSR